MKPKFSMESIEKKARKEIRLHRLISKNDVLYVLDDTKLTNVTVYDLLQSIIKDPSITIKKVKRMPKITQGKKFVLANTIEKESSEYISEFIKDKKREETNIIKPLIRISLEECRYYCDKKGLKYKDEHIGNDPVSAFVQGIQEKHDSTMHSIIRSEEILK